MKCPTCSQPVPRDTEGLIQARVATRIHAERAARKTAKTLADLRCTVMRVTPSRREWESIWHWVETHMVLFPTSG